MNARTRYKRRLLREGRRDRHRHPALRTRHLTPGQRMFRAGRRDAAVERQLMYEILGTRLVDQDEDGPPLFAPLTGFDLFLAQRYAPRGDFVRGALAAIRADHNRTAGTTGHGPEDYPEGGW